MTQEAWTSVDEYINELFSTQDDVLNEVLQTSTDAELPAIAVSAPQGKMLMILAQSTGAKSILEIGTLGGYSAIWLARALPPGGTLVTLEYEQKHASIAEKNLKRAGVDKQVEVIVGAAVDTLPKLVGDKRAPFDLIFIDADKQSYFEYLKWSVKLSRVGTLIIADNVVREGGVIDPNHPDERVQGVRRFNELLAGDSRFTSTIIQTVGGKGYDGFALIRVERL